MFKFKIDKITYSKWQPRTPYDISKNKHNDHNEVKSSLESFNLGILILKLLWSRL